MTQTKEQGEKFCPHCGERREHNKAFACEYIYKDGYWVRREQEKHTPGEWIVGNPGETEEGVIRIYAPSIETGPIAEVFYWEPGLSKEEAEANALVMAASKNLLAAALAHRDEWHRNTRNFNRLEPESLCLARQAIAKAGGR